MTMADKESKLESMSRIQTKEHEEMTMLDEESKPESMTRWQCQESEEHQRKRPQGIPMHTTKQDLFYLFP